MFIVVVVVVVVVAVQPYVSELEINKTKKSNIHT